MRLLSIVLALATGAWSHTGSMLMLCHGADGHSEIESISASCCQPAAESSDASVPEATEALRSAGCADSCSDTPLLTSVDRPAPPRSVSRGAAPALPVPLIAIAAGLNQPARGADGSERAWGITEPQQLTVLRI